MEHLLRAPRWAVWAGAVAAGLVCLVLAAYLLAGPLLLAAAATADVDEELLEDPELPGLEQRSVVRAADGSILAVLHAEVDRVEVPLDAVPEHVRQAVLVAEDRRFHEHDGYDLRAIGRAVWANFQAGEPAEGASTIPQQLAQANFLDAEQTFARKLRELRLAVALEREFTKDELLERYLNQVYFGTGAYGIAAAAEHYFRVLPEHLTVDQAALLGGIIRSPARLDPRTNPEAATARRNHVLTGMAEEGYLEAAEAEELQALPVEVHPPLEREARQPHVIEAVKREFASLEAFGETAEERFDALFAGGLDIETTINPHLQRIADELVAATFEDPDGPTAALAALDPRTGRIRALHGGQDFERAQFDLATQGRRQPGSALKPLVLAAALEQGFPPDMVLEGDGPLEITLPGAVEPWEPHNFGGANYGTVDLQQAVTRSVNTAFAQLILAAGVEETVDLAGRLGVNVDAAFGPPETWGPSIVLGGLTTGVTPLELAGAYGTLANLGVYAPPHLISRVVDASGEVVYERQPASEPVLHEAVAEAVTEMLTDVVRNGTGTAAQLPGWAVSGKTGTNEDFADAWFAGSVPGLTTTVWVGHPDAQVPMPGMTGGSLPAQLWREFMTAALEGSEPGPFPAAGSSLADLATGDTLVPDVLRMDVDEALLAVSQARLVGQAQQVADAAPAGLVVGQQPQPGTRVGVGEAVVLRVSTGTPPPDDDEDEDDEEGDGHPHGGPPGQHGRDD